VTTVVDVFTVSLGFVSVSVVVVAVMTGLVSVTDCVSVTVAATRVCAGRVGLASTVSELVDVVRSASVALRVPLAAVPPPPQPARRTADRKPTIASRSTTTARVQKCTIDGERMVAARTDSIIPSGGCSILLVRWPSERVRPEGLALGLDSEEAEGDERAA
jgi:hypothetical protein